MSTSDFVKLGQQLMEQGVKLDRLKVERDALNAQIATLEAEIAPIFLQYNTLLGEVMGKAISPPPQPAAVASGHPPSPVPTASGTLKGGALGVPNTGTLGNRISLYIRRAEQSGQVEGKGLSAEQIAAGLGVPAESVKEALATMRSNSRRAAAEAASNGNSQT